MYGLRGYLQVSQSIGISDVISVEMVLSAVALLLDYLLLSATVAAERPL